jgi:quinol monooxygenase YgiN
MMENAMNSNHVTVVYKWTAHPGKLDELSAIYRDVPAAMEQNEPGAEAVHVYVSEADNALYVRDELTDAAAVGFHLEVATPGPFFFMGDVPDEMKQATHQMGLGGQFSSHVAGFDR